MSPVEEPLVESAPLARELAARLCWRNPETGETCAWYHGLWQHLRLMRLAAGPEHHADFYREALGDIASSPGPHRVLISGTADYSMPAHALAAFRNRSVEPELTVNDLCETPLALSRWYAERVGCRIDTLCGDILHAPEDRTFDVVCTDSFLGRFPPEKRAELLKKWWRLLRPGGRVVTIKRIRPGSSAQPTGFSGREAGSFEEKVLKKAEALRGPLAIDPRELAENVRIYASRRRTWPVRSRDEIRDLFEQGGFRIERLDCHPVTGTQERTGGPGMLGAGDYARIVAIRLPA